MYEAVASLQQRIVQLLAAAESDEESQSLIGDEA